eukprot:403340414
MKTSHSNQTQNTCSSCTENSVQMFKQRDINCLKCRTLKSPKDGNYSCNNCEENTQMTKRIRSIDKDLLPNKRKMNLICKLHDGLNANQYCNKCSAYGCQQCAQKHHKNHRDSMEIVTSSQIQRKIKSKIQTAQREIDRLTSYIQNLSLLEKSSQDVDINDFHNALNLSIQTQGNTEEAEDTEESTPVNNSENDIINPLEMDQTQSRKESSDSSSISTELTSDQHSNPESQKQRKFDAFGQESMIQKNQQLKQLIKNNKGHSPFKITKFSYLCFQHLDGILKISKILEQLQQQYSPVFQDYKIIDNICNIYIDTFKQDWEIALIEIEKYMPNTSIHPLRHIRIGFEHFFINAFIKNYCKYWNDKNIMVNFISTGDPKISKYLYSEDSFYSETNQPEEIKYWAVVAISVLEKDKAELDHIRSLMNGFLLNEYLNQYELFCICGETDFASRAHIVVYLKKFKLIDQALESKGYHDKKVDYRTHKQMIFVKATQKEFDNFFQEAENAIDNQKVEKKFNVYLSEVFREVTQIDEKTKQEHQICEYVSIPVIKGFKEHQYQIQVTGTQLDEAIDYIYSILNDYTYVELKLQNMKFAQYSNLARDVAPIKERYRVVADLVNGSFHIYGNSYKGRLEEFLRQLKALIPRNLKKN